MKREIDEIREFVIIREDGDPQRQFLLEDFSGTFDILLFGDECHDGISERITGFLEGVSYSGIDYILRSYECQFFGEDEKINIRKIYLDEFRSDFEIVSQNGEVIELI